MSGNRFAVSDGASDGFASDRWASLLANAYSESGEDFFLHLPELRQRWQAEATRDPLPWYAQARLERGAAATLLGIEVSEDNTWKAVAVGDSNLFQVRGNELITAFPLTRADDFSGMPLLLQTRAGNPPPCQIQSGTWETGDDIFLATDALAAWFLAETERGAAPWKWLRVLADTGNFDHFLEEQRGLKRLRNDDTTLLHLRFDGV